MASKNIFRAIIFVFFISNFNLLNAQQLTKTEIGDGNGDFFSQPTFRPEYLKAQAQSNEPVLVILIQFPETDTNVFTRTTQEHWYNQFFGNKPSIKDYFATTSYGKLNLIPAAEKNAPENNGVVGWYYLLKSLNWYKNTYTAKNESYGQIAKDALIAANGAVNYASFDSDNNGYISSNELHIYIIVACYEEFYKIPKNSPNKETKLRRSHFNLIDTDPNENWNIVLELDGKKIGDENFGGGICLSAELLGEYESDIDVPIKVGFLAHEIGHDLVPTLPEHYCTPEDDPANAGIWCLMGKGDIHVNADYPTHICAYHKLLLGWVEAETIKSDMTCNLPQIETNNRCLLLCENGNSSSEFFIVENRQKQAPNVYDCNLPGSGLLIWHIDQKAINTTKDNGVVLERADDNIGNGVGDAGDLFIKGNAFLEESSKPNSRKNFPDDDITGVVVSNISAQGSVMTADIKISHVPNQISSTSSTNIIPANGNATSLISAYLLDTWADTVESATNAVTFSIAAGDGSGQLVGANPVTAVNGIAAISLQATSTPGTVTIEATAPNLTSGQARVHVYSTLNPTEVGGEIKTNTTWTLATSPYLVVSDIQVHSNACLTIQPGVTVLFNSGTGLRIAGDYWQGDPGSLSAEGNAANPIIFTSASGNVGDWKGILFDDHSDRDVSSILSHCVVEKAGQANARGINANIHCFNTNTPALSNCTISNSSGYGIYLQSSSPSISNNKIINSSTSEVIYLNSSSSTINSNIITGNGSSYWLYCATNGTNPTLINNTFTGSVTKAVRLGTNFQLNGNSFTGATDISIEVWGGDLNTIRTWNQQTGSFTYKIVSSDLYVHSNGSLRIEPRVKLLFNSGTGLRIAGDYWQGDPGSLSAEGNAANPIIFTSASGNVGDWKGILFDDHSDRDVSSILSHCVVEKAGLANARNNNSAVFCRNTNMPIITNCVIQNNGAVGLYFDYASPSVNKSKIINNTSYGIYCNISSHPTIGNAQGATNDIYGNGTYDIYVTGADNINARYNYWGTTNEAQIKTRIYDKYDNPNSGEVLYSPWATESGGANQPPTEFSLFSPLNNSVIKILNPTLTWQKSDDVDGAAVPIYTAQVGINPDFISNYFEFYDIKQETYTLPQPLTDKTKYYWRIKATDEENASTWSNEIWSFSLDLNAANHPPLIPILLLPINGEEALPDNYLVWTQSSDPDVGDVIRYSLELDNNPDFSSPEIRQSGISGDATTSGNPLAPMIINAIANAVYVQLNALQNYTQLKDDSTYYWRVQAVDQSAAESGFTAGSSHFFFNKFNTAPQPVVAGFSPKDGLEVRTQKPEISWHPAKDADLSDHPGVLCYPVQLADNAGFANYLSYTTGAGLNTFEVPVPLSENAKWFYRVQTMDDEGLISAWSLAQHFLVNAVDEPPAAFALHFPANNSTVSTDSVTFSWANTFDVDPNDKISFTFELSPQQNFAENLISAPNQTDSCLKIGMNAMAKSAYFWRVKAIDSDGLVTWGGQSGNTPWSFILATAVVSDYTAGVPTTFALFQNYPNPFNPETTIRYQLPVPGHIQLNIYNTLGQEIRTLFDGEQSAGFYQFLWDGEDNLGFKVGSGIYICQLRTEQYVAVKKMVVIQ